MTKGSLTVSTLEPGDLFGAAALYNDSPRLCHHPHRPRDLPLPPCWTRSCWTAFWGREALLRRNYLTYLTGRIRFLNARLGSLAVGGIRRAGWSAICSAASPMA